MLVLKGMPALCSNGKGNQEWPSFNPVYILMSFILQIYYPTCCCRPAYKGVIS